MSEFVLTDGASTIVQFPYTIRQLRMDNRNVSFPPEMTAQQLADWNVFPVVRLSQPVYDPLTQRLEINAQPTLNLGVWERGWTVMNLDAQTQTILARRNIDSDFRQQFDAERKSMVGLDDDRVIFACLIILTEIKAYQANNSVPTPAVDVLVSVWGGTKGQAVTRFMDKYGPKMAKLVKKFAVREDAFDALPLNNSN